MRVVLVDRAFQRIRSSSRRILCEIPRLCPLRDRTVRRVATAPRTQFPSERYAFDGEEWIWDLAGWVEHLSPTAAIDAKRPHAYPSLSGARAAPESQAVAPEQVVSLLTWGPHLAAGHQSFTAQQWYRSYIEAIASLFGVLHIAGFTSSTLGTRSTPW